MKNKFFYILFLLYFLTLPFYSTDLIVFLSISEIIIIFLFILVIIDIFRKKKNTITTVKLVYISLVSVFIIINFVHLLLIQNENLFSFTTSVINIFLIISVIFYFNENEKVTKYAMVSLYVGLLLFSLFGITQYIFYNVFSINFFLVQDYSGSRISGLFTNPNSYAFFLHYGVIFSFIYFYKEKGIKNLALLIIFVVAIYLSGSSGALFSSLIAISIYMLRKASLHKKIILLLAGISMLLIVVSYTNTLNFLLTDDGLESRLQIWAFTLNDFTSNLFFGVGFGNFREYLQSDYLSHNLYLQVLVETGIVGIALFLLLIFGPLTLFRKSQNIKNEILVFSLLSMVLHSFFINSFNSPILWVVVALAISLRSLKEIKYYEEDISLPRNAKCRRIEKKFV